MVLVHLKKSLLYCMFSALTYCEWTRLVLCSTETEMCWTHVRRYSKTKRQKNVSRRRPETYCTLTGTIITIHSDLYKRILIPTPTPWAKVGWNWFYMWTLYMETSSLRTLNIIVLFWSLALVNWAARDHWWSIWRTIGLPTFRWIATLSWGVMVASCHKGTMHFYCIQHTNIVHRVNCNVLSARYIYVGSRTFYHYEKSPQF